MFKLLSPLHAYNFRDIIFDKRQCIDEAHGKRVLTTDGRVLTISEYNNRKAMSLLTESNLGNMCNSG